MIFFLDNVHNLNNKKQNLNKYFFLIRLSNFSILKKRLRFFRLQVAFYLVVNQKNIMPTTSPYFYWNYLSVFQTTNVSNVLKGRLFFDFFTLGSVNKKKRRQRLTTVTKNRFVLLHELSIQDAFLACLNLKSRTVSFFKTKKNFSNQDYGLVDQYPFLKIKKQLFSFGGGVFYIFYFLKRLRLYLLNLLNRSRLITEVRSLNLVSDMTKNLMLKNETYSSANLLPLRDLSFKNYHSIRSPKLNSFDFVREELRYKQDYMASRERLFQEQSDPKSLVQRYWFVPWHLLYYEPFNRHKSLEGIVPFFYNLHYQQQKKHTLTKINGKLLRLGSQFSYFSEEEKKLQRFYTIFYLKRRFFTLRRQLYVHWKHKYHLLVRLFQSTKKLPLGLISNILKENKVDKSQQNLEKQLEIPTLFSSSQSMNRWLRLSSKRGQSVSDHVIRFKQDRARFWSGFTKQGVTIRLPLRLRNKTFATRKRFLSRLQDLYDKKSSLFLSSYLAFNMPDNGALARYVTSLISNQKLDVNTPTKFSWVKQLKNFIKNFSERRLNWLLAAHTYRRHIDPSPYSSIKFTNVLPSLNKLGVVNMRNWLGRCFKPTISQPFLYSGRWQSFYNEISKLSGIKYSFFNSLLRSTTTYQLDQEEKIFVLPLMYFNRRPRRLLIARSGLAVNYLNQLGLKYIDSFLSNKKLSAGGLYVLNRGRRIFQTFFNKKKNMGKFFVCLSKAIFKNTKLKSCKKFFKTQRLLKLITLVLGFYKRARLLPVTTTLSYLYSSFFDRLLMLQTKSNLNIVGRWVNINAGLSLAPFSRLILKHKMRLSKVKDSNNVINSDVGISIDRFSLLKLSQLQTLEEKQCELRLPLKKTKQTFSLTTFFNPVLSEMRWVDMINSVNPPLSVDFTLGIGQQQYFFKNYNQFLKAQVIPKTFQSPMHTSFTLFGESVRWGLVNGDLLYKRLYPRNYFYLTSKNKKLYRFYKKLGFRFGFKKHSKLLYKAVKLIHQHLPNHNGSLVFKNKDFYQIYYYRILCSYINLGIRMSSKFKWSSGFSKYISGSPVGYDFRQSVGRIVLTNREGTIFITVIDAKGQTLFMVSTGMCSQFKRPNKCLSRRRYSRSSKRKPLLNKTSLVFSAKQKMKKVKVTGSISLVHQKKTKTISINQETISRQIYSAISFLLLYKQQVNLIKPNVVFNNSPLAANTLPRPINNDLFFLENTNDNKNFINPTVFPFVVVVRTSTLYTQLIRYILQNLCTVLDKVCNKWQAFVRDQLYFGVSNVNKVNKNASE